MDTLDSLPLEERAFGDKAVAMATADLKRYAPLTGLTVKRRWYAANGADATD